MYLSSPPSSSSNFSMFLDLSHVHDITLCVVSDEGGRDGSRSTWRRRCSQSHSQLEFASTRSTVPVHRVFRDAQQRNPGQSVVPRSVLVVLSHGIVFKFVAVGSLFGISSWTFRQQKKSSRKYGQHL